MLPLHPLLPALWAALCYWWQKGGGSALQDAGTTTALEPAGSDGRWQTSRRLPSSPGRALREPSEGDRYDRGKWYDARGEELPLPFVCKMSTLGGPDASGGCPGGWIHEGISCYRYSGEDYCLQFDDADEHCKSLHPEARLVSILHADENDVVMGLCGHAACWIGLREAPSTEEWEWVDGSGSETTTTEFYFNWQDGEPNNFGFRDEDKAFMTGWFDEHGEQPEEYGPLCWRGEHDDEGWVIASAVLYWGVQLAFGTAVFCCGCCYKGKVTDVRPRPFPSADVLAQGPLGMTRIPDFRFQLCGCLEDGGVCCMALFCGAVRAADTYATAQVAAFNSVLCAWAATYMLLVLMDCVISVVLALTTEGASDPQFRNWLLPLIFASMMVKNRQGLRRAFGSNGSEKAQCCTDFLVWWCCTFCAIAQEARQVDAAQGVSAGCCCQLNRWPSSSAQVIMQSGMPGYLGAPTAGVVGAPVVAQGGMAQGGPPDPKGQPAFVGQQPTGQPVVGQVVGQPVLQRPGVVVVAATPVPPAQSNFVESNEVENNEPNSGADGSPAHAYGGGANAYGSVAT